MKHSTNNLITALKSFVMKVAFCSQLLLISLALPSLFYVGITYNNEGLQKKNLHLTNKGKKILATDKGENEKTIKYFPAFLQL
ncbi:MAG: hypothetical protein JWO92_2417 [Chitinophagaceae bacterium]|nr:hypothetical protein [Chitinophagaceae bacterium]